MVQTQQEKERLLKAGWFFAHRENGRIVTDEDEWRQWLGNDKTQKEKDRERT